MPVAAHDFRSVKAKVRVLCKQRRIRLEEFMKTFDVHHVKKIRVDQFKRALDVSGLQLTAEDMAAIVAKYRFPEDPSFVDYRRFCDLIDKAFTVKGLEAKPELRASIHSSLPPEKKFALATLTDSEQQELASAKSKLAVAVRNKGLVLKDVFHDFDRSNAGKVTKPQFVRDLLDIAVLSSAEVAALVKAYGNDLDVNYKALHYDISSHSADSASIASSGGSSSSPERRRRLSAPSSSFAADTLALQELEATLCELVVRDRIRTKNFFTDFDPLRTGKCSEPQFKRCVKLCFSAVSESELALLVNKYATTEAPVKVDYVRFCHHIEGKRSDDSSNYEDALASMAARTFSVTSPTATSVKCTRDVRGSLSDRELETYQAVMQRLTSFVAQRRLLIKPSFQDFDKGRREHITVEQFIRVMTMLKLSLANDSERHVLLKRYASAHGDRFVNYVTFCHDMEHWQDGAGSPRPGSSSKAVVSAEILSPTRATLAVATARSVPMVLRAIKQTVKRDRIRLDEFYRDFDKLRHGRVTAAQFAAGLSAGGLLLTPEEARLLADEYAVKDGEVDSAGQPLVSWKQFVDDVESVFTVKGLERTPHCDLTPLQSKGEQFGGAVAALRSLTADEERVVTQAVVVMKKAMDRQRLEIKAAFEDFDRAKQGFVSSTKFERVLSMFQLLPADATTARLLVVKFREQAAAEANTLSSLGDVNYRAFLQALDLVGHHLHNGSANDLVLPGSVAYRQGVYDGGVSTLEGTRRKPRNDGADSVDPGRVLDELRRQLLARRIRMKEFIVEGDKLRSGEITVAKFHTALNRSGCVLDAADVHTLTARFQSARHADKIDWRSFLDALDQSASPALLHDDATDAGVEEERDPAVQAVLTKLRREVSHRRLHMKPYFQDYDHNRVGRVTKFQFAAVLDMMKLSVLSERDIAALQRAFAVVGPGRKPTSDVHYVRFIQAVDSEYS